MKTSDSGTSKQYQVIGCARVRGGRETELRLWIVLLKTAVMKKICMESFHPLQLWLHEVCRRGVSVVEIKIKRLKNSNFFHINYFFGSFA